jgi:hypothetical protein
MLQISRRHRERLTHIIRDHYDAGTGIHSSMYHCWKTQLQYLKALYIASMKKEHSGAIETASPFIYFISSHGSGFQTMHPVLLIAVRVGCLVILFMATPLYSIFTSINK